MCRVDEASFGALIRANAIFPGCMCRNVARATSSTRHNWIQWSSIRGNAGWLFALMNHACYFAKLKSYI